MAQTLEQIICDCFIVSIYLFIIHLFLSINIHLNKIAIKHLNSYLEESRGEVQSLYGKFGFKSFFEWSVASFHFILHWIFSNTPIHPPLGVISPISAHKHKKIFMVKSPITTDEKQLSDEIKKAICRPESVSYEAK